MSKRFPTAEHWLIGLALTMALLSIFVISRPGELPDGVEFSVSWVGAFFALWRWFFPKRRKKRAPSKRKTPDGLHRTFETTKPAVAAPPPRLVVERAPTSLFDSEPLLNVAPTPQTARAPATVVEARTAPAVKPRKVVSVPSWQGRGAAIKVGEFILNDPLTYFSTRPLAENEASCIDLSLPIGKPTAETRGALGDYPSYARISPNQRANYLQWIERGRTGPLGDIGYAFLFFYGLERRLLVEGQDLSPIVKEVVRLLETYTISGPFDVHLSRFLSYALARSGIASLKEKWFEAIFDRTRVQRDEQVLAVGLAWLIGNDRPLPATWAMRIARMDPRSPRSVVIDRLPDKFRDLFIHRYVERFGEGMALKAAKRDREIAYQPTSPSLAILDQGSSELKPVKVPHVMGIQSQFAPLVEIWTNCVEELKPLSRVLAKGGETLTRAAYDALPDDLRAGVEHPDKAAWDKIASENAREDGVVRVSAGKLAAVQGIAERPKLTLKQSESLGETADAVGLLIEPDARLTHCPLSWDDTIALLRPELKAESERPSRVQESNYPAASLMLELGMYIAASDGEIRTEEVDHVAGFLETRFLLDPTETRRLEALKGILIERPPSIAGLGKRVQSLLDADRRADVGRFLVGVAAANGSIAKSEISALRIAYKALNVDVGILDRLLDEFRKAAQEPVEVVAPDDHSGKGETIPLRPREEAKARGFALDEAAVRRILAETRQVALLIGEAMRESERESEPEAVATEKTVAEPVRELAEVPVVVETTVTAVVPDPRFDGLPPRYQPALAELLSRTSWPKAEFDALSRRHHLMPSGVIDILNEWAESSFGDILIEENSPDLIVHTTLLPTEHA